MLGAESLPEIQVPRLADGAKIDGILNEDQWELAAAISDFTQVEPVSMGVPSQRPHATSTPPCLRGRYYSITVKLSWRCQLKNKTASSVGN